ncbi:hypothetical protein B0H17DRAFT_164966 [Mycena rosella]|uniref:Uncharacterized protein n=1 Tax=Mycena rosella TaxID=1033263 RepID=A0AAD7GMB6_MYCRO|nr:hypothetical protein B0H17DRAFT_164966 [Mycena rosella]
MQQVIFSKNAVNWLFKRGGFDLAVNAPVQKTFLLVVGVALEELGQEELMVWFANTFGPLVTAVEDALVAHQNAPIDGAKARRLLKYSARATHGEPLAKKPCPANRQGPSSLQIFDETKPSFKTGPHNHKKCIPARPRGFVQKCLFAVAEFATAVSTALFGSLQAPPPTGYTVPAGLPSYMLAYRDSSSTVPTALVFAPRLGFVPARLPPQDLAEEED